MDSQLPLRGKIGGLALLLPVLAAAHASSRPTVVELYTSEGCSSCPPAEAYLRDLARRPDVLALSFHVDYWNELGWRDPWATGDFTERQRSYGQRLGLRSIFTPQAIVDGRDSYVGSDRSRIGSRLGAPPVDLPILLKLEGDDLVIAVGLTPGAADVLLLPFRRHVTSHIGRGENQGLTLEETNVVIQLRRVGRAGSAPLEMRVPMASMPRNATDVAALVQRANAGEILGATRLELRAADR